MRIFFIKKQKRVDRVWNGQRKLIIMEENHVMKIIEGSLHKAQS
jgi:hypothetical protein